MIHPHSRGWLRGARARAAARPRRGAVRRLGARGVVNVNTASAEELSLLPGVGPARARAIVELRQQRGGFKRVEDLLEVKGIGDASLAKLRPSSRSRARRTLQARLRARLRAAPGRRAARRPGASAPATLRAPMRRVAARAAACSRRRRRSPRRNPGAPRRLAEPVAHRDGRSRSARASSWSAWTTTRRARPAAAGLPTVGGLYDPSLEAVVALAPGPGGARAVRGAARLPRAARGARRSRASSLDPVSFDDVLAAIETLGARARSRARGRARAWRRSAPRARASRRQRAAAARAARRAGAPARSALRGGRAAPSWTRCCARRRVDEPRARTSPARWPRARARVAARGGAGADPRLLAGPGARAPLLGALAVAARGEARRVVSMPGRRRDAARAPTSTRRC